MTSLARTEATGGGGLHPRLLALSSSLSRDLPLLGEDLLGSMAHALALREAGLLTAEEAGALRRGLAQVLAEGGAALPEEEDVHMAVEALLQERLGPVAGKLHTGRSRNDQIALALALHLREGARQAGQGLSAVLSALCGLAEAHLETVMPGYTHRQRAIPITVAHHLMAAAAALSRDAALLRFALSQMDRCPLGAGALAGSSLPLRRDRAAALLGFRAPTASSLDTVGDRDAVSDLAYLSARLHGHLSRLCTDLIDFSTQEFAFVRLRPEIACGSSMMPHKKNPDLFELSRGRSARALGDLMAVLSLTRGLPLGYQRDLQEDRATVTAMMPHLRGTLELVELGLRHLEFDGEAMARALAGDATQATDLAEVLVLHGVPFRQAYRIVGGLVARAREQGQGLLALAEALPALLPAELASRPGLVADLVARLPPQACVGRRDLPGGPAPAAVRDQIVEVKLSIEKLNHALGEVPTLKGLLDGLMAVPL